MSENEVPAPTIELTAEPLKLSRLQKLVWGTLTTVVGAVAVAVVLWLPEFAQDVHADEHVIDQKRLDAVQSTAEANARYISDQLLAALYVRASSLRAQLASDPGNPQLVASLASVTVEIQRREQAMSASR